MNTNTITIVKPSAEEFRREMAKARTMQEFDSERSEYWIGYQRGMRRAFHGDKFGMPSEHRVWLKLIYDTDPMRQQRGKGYRDALQGEYLKSEDVL